MTDNVVTLAGKPAGMSEDAAKALREECERAIRDGAHVLIVTTSCAGRETRCRAVTAHAEGTSIPLATFYRDAYKTAHALMMNGEEEWE